MTKLLGLKPIYLYCKLDVASCWTRLRIPARLYSFGAGSLKDYYNLLGVPRDATQRQIKNKYYELSKKYHPDISGPNTTNASRFVEINEAYETLKDPDRRRAYDIQLLGGGGGRYTGDGTRATGSPFGQEFGRRGQGNPFYSREYTQAEYDRRIRREHNYHNQSRADFERQRMWAEFARNRANRWQQFHQRYPNGPPGSIKWNFNWSNNNQQQQGIAQGWELFRKIMMVYFVCFFVISIIRIALEGIGNSNDRKSLVAEKQKTDKEKLAELMSTPPVRSSTVKPDREILANPLGISSNSVPRSSVISSVPLETLHDEDHIWQDVMSTVPMDKHLQAQNEPSYVYSTVPVERHLSEPKSQF